MLALLFSSHRRRPSSVTPVTPDSRLPRAMEARCSPRMEESLIGGTILITIPFRSPVVTLTDGLITLITIGSEKFELLLCVLCLQAVNLYIYISLIALIDVCLDYAWLSLVLKGLDCNSHDLGLFLVSYNI